MPRKSEVKINEPEKPVNTSAKCLVCEKYTVASFPVHLTDWKGKTSIVCHVARCANCGKIKNYGARNGIFKFNFGKKPDFGIEYWPELRQNGIDRFEFEEAILRSPNGPIYLDVRNGLNPPPIPKEWDDRLKNFLATIRE